MIKSFSSTFLVFNLFIHSLLHSFTYYFIHHSLLHPSFYSCFIHPLSSLFKSYWSQLILIFKQQFYWPYLNSLIFFEYSFIYPFIFSLILLFIDSCICSIFFDTFILTIIHSFIHWSLHWSFHSFSLIFYWSNSSTPFIPPSSS